MTAQIVKFPIIARPIPGDVLEQIASERAEQQGLPHKDRWKLLVQAGYALLARERAAAKAAKEQNNAGSGRAAK